MPSTLAQETPAVRAEQPSRGELRIVTILTAILFAAIAAALIRPIFSRESWLTFVQDDFLYYLKVAQNIAHGRGSTFNGIAPTNGYQPLWELCLIALSRVTENPRLILGFLACTDFLAAATVFLLARRLLRTTGVRPLLVFTLAAWVTLYSVTLFFYGMEVTLTVPIMLGLLCMLLSLDWLTRSPLHTFALGLLLSAMVLSRIDTLILGGLLLAGILLTPSLRSRITLRLSVGAAVGLLPVAFYFALNHVLFQTWLPISGEAKQIKLSTAPSIEPWRDFSHPVSFAFILIILTAISLLPSTTRRLKTTETSPIQMVLFRAVLLFPLLYYCVLSFVSDWPLWGWYIYPIRAAICVSFVIFCLYPPLARTLQRPGVVGLLLLTVLATAARMRWTVQGTDTHAAALEIQRFAATHHGTYAMGDRSGSVGILLDDPIIQTEGLMMDRGYLDLVRKQTPLREALAHYNVRYYIGTAYKPFTGCFEASEPAKAGPHSAHMRGKFCEPPLATYFHHGFETLIFDLHPAQKPD